MPPKGFGHISTAPQRILGILRGHADGRSWQFLQINLYLIIRDVYLCLFDVIGWQIAGTLGLLWLIWVAEAKEVLCGRLWTEEGQSFLAGYGIGLPVSRAFQQKLWSLQTDELTIYVWADKNWITSSLPTDSSDSPKVFMPIIWEDHWIWCLCRDLGPMPMFSSHGCTMSK